jgi:hypothetical protein
MDVRARGGFARKEDAPAVAGDNRIAGGGEAFGEGPHTAGIERG